MAQTCWENVLVEWVNCLNLCKSIDTLEELRGGNFYKRLLKIVKSPGTEGNTVNFVFDLLKKQYPNFLLEVEDAASWRDFSHNDLLSITSLLLHHTCITDRQEAITSPLCSKLPQVTQLNIKLFLENVDFDVTKEKLDEVIERCMNIKEIDLAQAHFHTVYEGSLKCDSPLQGLLNGTPKGKKKSVLLEKEREIKQLKNDLELERYEKADLQEELKLQQEKNKDLQKELNVKLRENKRLRGENLALQNKTPPHFDYGDSLQMQRRLKSEIGHLEGYIKKLEKEQCDLEEQLQQKSDILKKLEEECSMWQSKALSLETTNESLYEKLEQQQLEITNLQQHSRELSAILEEFKTPKSPDTSATWVTNLPNRRSFGSTDTNEDLAQTVIDVQLKDVQKENEDLRKSLNEYVVKIEVLSLELNEVNAKCENSQDELSELQEINAGLCTDLLKCQESLKTCQKELESAIEVNGKIKHENVGLQGRIEGFEKEQVLLTGKLKDCEALNSQLQNEVADLKSNCEETSEKLDLAVEDHKKLELIVEKYYKSLEMVLFEGHDEGVCFEDKEHLFATLLANIVNQVKTKAEEREKLNQKMVGLQEQIEKLNEKKRNVLAEKLQVEENLTACQNELESALEVNEKIQKHNIDLQEDIVKLESAKHLLSNQLEDNKILISQLQNELTDLRNSCDVIQSNLKEKESSLQLLTQENGSLRGELEETSEKLDLAVKDRKTLELIVQKYYKSLEMVLFEEHDEGVCFEDKEHLFATLLANIENQKESKAEEREKLNEKMVDLLEQIEKLNEKERKVLADKLQVEENLTACQKELESALEVNKEIRKHNGDLQEDIVKLESVKHLLSNQLEDNKILISQLKNELTDLGNNCEVIQSNLKEKESNLQLLTQENGSLRSELEKTSETLNLAVEDHKKLELIVEKYYKSLEMVLFEEHDEGVCFEDKENLFATLLANIENQKETKAEEREKLNEKMVNLREQIDELNETQRNVLAEKFQVIENFIKCQETLTVCQKKLASALKDIGKLESDKHLLSGVLEDNKILISQQQNELTDLKNHCEVIQSHLKEKESNLQLLTQENVSLRGELEKTSETLDLAVEDHKKLELIVEKYYKSLEMVLFEEHDEGVCFEDKENLFATFLANIENQKETKAEEREKLNEKMVNLQEQIDELNEKQRNVLAEKFQVVENFIKCQETLTVCQKGLASALKDIGKLESDKHLLSGVLEDNKVLISQQQNELTDLKNHCEVIQSHLKEKESNLQLLTQENVSLRGELEKTFEKLDLAVEDHKILELIVEKYYKSLEMVLFEEHDEGVCFDDKERLFATLVANIVKTKAEEREKLNKQIVDYQEQIDKLTEKERNVLAENLQVEGNLTVCKETLTTYQQELASASEINAKLRIDNANLQEHIVKLENVKALLSNDLEDCKTLINKLENKLTCLKNQCEVVQSTLKEKESNLELLKQTGQSLLVKLSETESELKETSQKLDVAVENYKKLEVVLEKFYKRLQSLLFEENEDVSLDDKEFLLEVVEKQVAEKCEKIKKLQDQIEGLNEKEMSILAEKHQVEENLSKSEAANKVLQEANEVCCIKITELERKIVELIEQLNQLTQETNHQIIKLNSECSELQREKDAQQQNILKELADQRLQIDSLQTENIGYISSLQALTADKTNLLKNCEVLEDKIKHLGKVISELQTVEKKLTETVQEKEAEMQEMKTAAEINEKKSKEALNGTIKQYTCEIDKMKAVASDFNLKEIGYLDEINELKRELSNTMDKYTESLQLQQEIKTESEVQIANLTENLHDLVTKYNKCCSDLQNAETLKCELEQQFVKLTGLVDKLEDNDVIDSSSKNVGFVLEKAVEKITKVVLQTSSLRKENDDSKKLCLEMQANLNDFYKTEDGYKNILTEKELEIKNSQIMIANCEQQIYDLNQRQTQLECDVDKWKKQCEDSEVVIADHENKIISMKDIQELIDVEKETLQRECASLKEELKSCNLMLKETEKRHEEVVSQLNLKIDSLESKSMQVREIQQQLQEEQINLELAWKKEKQMLLEDLKKLKSERETREEALKTANANNETVKDLVREYKEILAEKTETINKLQEVVQDNQQKCERLNEIIEENTVLQEEKRLLEDNLEELKTQAKQKGGILESYISQLQDVEEKLSLKIDDLTNTNSVLLEKCDEFEAQLHKEKQSKQMLEKEVSELQLKKSDFEQLFEALSQNIKKLENLLSEDLNDDGYTEELPSVLAIVVEKVLKLVERQNILQNINAELEKLALDNKEVISDLKLKHDMLQARYEQLLKHSEINEQQNKKVAEVEESVKKFKNNFAVLCKDIKVCQEKLEKVFCELFSTEQLLDNTRATVNQLPAINEISHKILYERKESVEIIFEDINKQAHRYSKKLGSIVCKLLQVFENTINSILTGDDKTKFSENLNIDDEIESLQDLKSRAEDALHQVNTLNKDIAYKLETKPTSVLKENTNPQTQKLKDDELKRKNTSLKQRVTLAENAKSNLERKIKQLREENKKLLEGMSLGFVSKMEHERILNANTTKYQNLLQQYEDLASKCVDLSQEKGGQSETHYKQLHNEYCTVMNEKSQLERQYEATRKTLEDYAAQVAELSLIKEAYDKLVEENNQLMTQCDTLNYKRTRDREEYGRALQEVKKECEAKENKKIREIRGEYETKLEKMKEKMIKLYKEEVDKEMQKLSSEKSENVYLMRNIEQLRGHLQEANLKMHQIELERDRALDRMKHMQKQVSRQENELVSSRESLRSVTSREGSVISGNLPRGERPMACRSSVSSKISSNSVAPLNPFDSVGGRSEIDFDESSRVFRTMSVASLPSELGHNLKMEDEDDDFNNKYLSDLKEGKCVLPTEKKANASDRLSELAWRNSLCPPHLKSSYPAELQFVSPSCFKEDDIKAGNIELDDSLSTKLLPCEKPRNKKDIGTTSYKKPGPPTPSKNGGRLSLQGNEGREPSQEQSGEVKTPKRMTPKRLKALFMGRNANAKDNSENRSTTPRARRLSNIFRKPR